MTRSNRDCRRERKLPPAAPLLLQADLMAWAGATVAGGGRKMALLGRVELLRLAPGGDSLEARVRGNRPLPYQVEVALDRGTLTSSCTCARDYAACKHAVAALEALRFPMAPAAASPRPQRSSRGGGRIIQPAVRRPGFLVLGSEQRQQTREERIAMARAEELALRRQWARSDRSRVLPLSDDDGPPTFEVAPRAAPPERVTLRGPTGRYAGCTCADFGSNELETCRHVERLRRWYLRKPKWEPVDLASIWWRPRVWTEDRPEPLREIFLLAPDHGSPIVSRYFEPEGWLRPAPAGNVHSKWARRAVSAIRRLARRNGWRTDLDPAVNRRIAAADAAEAMDRKLAPIVVGAPEWRELRHRLGFDLHPYQETGALFLGRRGRAFLADDMGLGKTVQSVAAALLLRQYADARRALIVCPASIKHQWHEEILRACGESALVVDGRPAERREAYRAWESGFLILNYELVLRDLDEILAAGSDLIVLDEAQRIKNWETKTARAVKRLQSPFAFVLTGTPLENRLPELQSLVEFLHPRALGPRWRQLPYHAVTAEGGRVVAYEGLDVLRRRLSGYFLRRERRGVLDQLPERTENTFRTGMTPVQRRAYRRQAARMAVLLTGKGGLGPAEVRVLLQMLTNMRILCNAHAQFDWQRHVERLVDPAPPTPLEVRALHSPKLEEFVRVLEDLLDESDARIVVFSQWKRMLQLAGFVARETLESRDLRAELFHGGLGGNERREMIEAFHRDPEFRVLLSTDAGGLGLNLQRAASIVVHLEVPWNPAVLEQRIGRVHRLGQRKSVQVLHFVTRGGVEERVQQAVESKRALFEGLLVDELDRIDLDVSRSASLVDRVRSLIGDSDGR